MQPVFGQREHAHQSVGDAHQQGRHPGTQHQCGVARQNRQGEFAEKANVLAEREQQTQARRGGQTGDTRQQVPEHHVAMRRTQKGGQDDADV